MSSMRSRNFDPRIEAEAVSMPRSLAGCASEAAPRIGYPITMMGAAVAQLWREHAGFVVTMTCCALYFLPCMRVIMPGTDQGSFLYGAVRLMHGQTFGRDFMEVMGPATFYWLALFYKLFGINFLATRACLLLSWMGTAIAVYALCKHIPRGYRALPLMLVVVASFGEIGMSISHHLDSNLLALLTVLCLNVWHGKRKASLLICAGSLAALTTLDLQPKGLLLLIAALAWVWIVERKRQPFVRAFAYVISGFAVILGISAVFFAAHGAFADVIRANWVWPFQHYSTINHVPYAWGTFAFNWRGAPLNTPGAYGTFLFASALMIPFLYIAVLPGLVILQAVQHRRQFVSAQLWLYLLCGFAVWASELHRKDIAHLVFGSPLLIILSVQLLTRSSSLLSRLSLIVLTTSSCTLAACNLLVVLSAQPVATRVGQVRVFSGGEVIAALTDRVAPGEEIFVYPTCPSYYFLTQTDNPTRFSILVSGYNTSAEVEEVIRAIDSHKVKHVLLDYSDNRKNALPLIFPAMLQLPDDLAPLEAYLRDRYTTVYDYRGFQILERKHAPIVQ